MTMITASQAQESLAHLLDYVSTSHEPVIITGASSNAILISEDDWRAINETLYLLGIPDMRESIVAGLNTPLDECVDEVEW